MENIRNFSIISHIDHGKSTLADRLLELTGTISKEKMRPQYLDMMDLERERGITIKMQPVKMQFEKYILNLIDTPGHADFSYEVSRALAAVEGAVLLVDGTRGIQAQTIGNLELAKKQNLVIIPVINKIDLPQVKITEVEKEISDSLNIDSSEIIKISAKQGTNIKELLEIIIKKVPSPQGEEKLPFSALIFDSKYDQYKGVIAFIRVFNGRIKKGEKIYLIQGKAQGEVREIGIFNPQLFPIEELKAGEMGYLATGIKEPGRVKVGDTIAVLSPNSKFQIPNIKPLPGYKEPQPMVFLSIYPESADDFELLDEALEKLKLNDASLTFKPELKEGLGRGFQCGFLGLLHTEIVTERLKREFGLDLVLSTPQVLYKSFFTDNQEFLIYTPADWPKDETRVKEFQEMWAKLEILTPQNYLGQVLELLKSIESNHIKTNYLGNIKTELIYEVPLREIISKNFYDKLKSVSQGFASMNYEVLGWRTVKLVRLDILILGEKKEAFSRIVPEKEANKEGKAIVEKLKETLPKQLFALPLQAAVGGKIIARETISAKRRDVIAPLYGGDYSRKRKLLERQKKGKKKLKARGKIKIPSSVFLEVFKSR